MSGIDEPKGAATPRDRPAQDSAAEPPWDVKVDGNRRRMTTAEQAIPWLIGLILALSGMVIVLLALIFSSADGLLPAFGSPSPESTATPTPRPTPRPTPEPTPETSTSVEPTPSPTPPFGALEIIFMQRTSPAGPVHLYSHDFANQDSPVPQARDDRGVDHYAWSPDGAWGLALVDGDMLALIPGSSARDLADGIDSVAFSASPATAYALRATLAGSNDRAELLSVDFASGAVQSLQIWTYPHPTTFQETAVNEAQFADDGGFNRVYVLDDGRLVVWVLGAPAIYLYDPATGSSSTTGRAPILWSPNGLRWIDLAVSGNQTSVILRGLANEERASIGVSGLVSHMRWSAAGNQVVFTLNIGVTGGVSQDLYLWNLEDGGGLTRLTQDQRTMGGEFRGVAPRYKP